MRSNLFPVVPTVLQATVLRDEHELVGPLDSVESVGDGLIHVSIAGLERLVSDELGAVLASKVGHWVSILRIGNRWSAAEMIGDKWSRIKKAV